MGVGCGVENDTGKQWVIVPKVGIAKTGICDKPVTDLRMAWWVFCFLENNGRFVILLWKDEMEHMKFQCVPCS